MRRPWGDYPDTLLTFAGGLAIDLRRPLSPPLRQRLGELGLGRPFGVVTACNPLGSRLDDAANRRLTSLLGQRILAGYGEARPAQGGSPDGSHREPGWAVPAPLEEVKRLAADFLQNAVFWYDGERFSIVPVLGPGEPLPLPLPAPAESGGP